MAALVSLMEIRGSSGRESPQSQRRLKRCRAPRWPQASQTLPGAYREASAGHEGSPAIAASPPSQRGGSHIPPGPSHPPGSSPGGGCGRTARRGRTDGRAEGAGVASRPPHPPQAPLPADKSAAAAAAGLPWQARGGRAGAGGGSRPRPAPHGRRRRCPAWARPRSARSAEPPPGGAAAMLRPPEGEGGRCRRAPWKRPAHWLFRPSIAARRANGRRRRPAARRSDWGRCGTAARAGSGGEGGEGVRDRLELPALGGSRPARPEGSASRPGPSPSVRPECPHKPTRAESCHQPCQTRL